MIFFLEYENFLPKKLEYFNMHRQETDVIRFDNF